MKKKRAKWSKSESSGMHGCRRSFVLSSCFEMTHSAQKSLQFASWHQNTYVVTQRRVRSTVLTLHYLSPIYFQSFFELFCATHFNSGIIEVQFSPIIRNVLMFKLFNVAVASIHIECTF